MKTRFSWVLLAMVGCSPPLEGALTFDFADDVLSIAFDPTDGQSFRVGTVFAQLVSHEATIGESETQRCTALPPDGRIQVALSEYTDDAKIDVAITHDDPRRDPNRDPKASLREPRPCEGVPVVARTWVNDTGLSRIEEPEVEDPKIEDPKVETKHGALAPIVVPELCATDEVELELHNVGEGPLEILSAELVDAALGVVTPSSATIEAGGRMTLRVSFSEPVVREALVIDTDEPDTRPHLVMLRGSRPELKVDAPGVNLLDRQTFGGFSIESGGCGELGDVRAELLPYPSTGEVPREFSIFGCTPGEDCRLRAGLNIVEYTTQNDSLVDRAMLRLTVVDDDSQEILLPISATARPCTATSIEVMRTNTSSVTCAREVQNFRAVTGGIIEDYVWRLSGQRGGMTIGVESTDASFTPNKPGSYAVDLVVVNECGALGWPEAPLEIIAEDCE